MSRYNDIDLQKWREYDDILTGSLWNFHRENSGVHNASYHGNFVPQVPRQLFSRYTKKGDWILDPFMGSGTSIIEAQRMGRNSIGIDLQEPIVSEAFSRIKMENNPECKAIGYVGDSKQIDFDKITSSLGIKKYQFVIFHPPYWDIIKFSEDKNDLSNAETLDDFLSSFGEVVDNTTRLLEKNRYCAVVIGDKYANSQIVPLGFYCMQLFMEKNFLLKAILVKDFDRTRGKAGKEAIWRYRALASDFYIFDHEYIFVFKKLR